MSDGTAEKQYVPECYACPIGTVSMAMQGAAPDATEHVIRAGRELLAAFKSMLDGLDGFLNIMEERSGAARKETTIEAIPIRRASTGTAKRSPKKKTT
ncbi:MAG: hypothetical protein WD646_15590 [Actinomycetota bacterium]